MKQIHNFPAQGVAGWDLVFTSRCRVAAQAENAVNRSAGGGGRVCLKVAARLLGWGSIRIIECLSFRAEIPKSRS